MIAGHIYPPTWLHRVPAAIKLLFLVAASGVFLMLSTWWFFLLGMLGVLALYASLGPAALRRLKLWKALLPLLAIIYLLQWYAAGHNQAAVSVGRLLVMIMLADLITMTTPMQAMLDAVCPLFRPFERFGWDGRKLALALALVIRFIPVLFDLWNKRREAWRARSTRRVPLSLIKLFVLDTLQMADQVAEALDARGFASQSLAKRKK